MLGKIKVWFILVLSSSSCVVILAVLVPLMSSHDLIPKDVQDKVNTFTNFIISSDLQVVSRHPVVFEYIFGV